MKKMLIPFFAILLCHISLFSAETQSTEFDIKIEKLKSLVKNNKLNESLILLTEIKNTIENKITSTKDNLIMIDICQLDKDMQQNAIKVNHNYKGKKVKIISKIHSMDKFNSQELRVILQCNEYGTSATCFFNIEQEEYLSSFQSGQTVEVIGDFDEGDQYNVNIKNCRITTINK